MARNFNRVLFSERVGFFEERYHNFVYRPAITDGAQVNSVRWLLLEVFTFKDGLRQLDGVFPGQPDDAKCADTRRRC